jgi:hypothetical protein
MAAIRGRQTEEYLLAAVPLFSHVSRTVKNGSPVTAAYYILVDYVYAGCSKPGICVYVRLA